MVSLVPAQTRLKNTIHAYVRLECSYTSQAPPSPAQSRNPRLEVLTEDYKESSFEISCKRVTLPQIRKLLVSTDALRHEVLP